MTPNYLGFLAQAPQQTESPLETAISKGLQTYGDVQKLRQQTMQTQEEGIELQDLPQQVHDMALARKYYIDALPQEIQNGLTKEQLENGFQQLTNQAKGMDVDQARSQLVTDELSKLYQTYLNYPDQTQNQWDISRKKLIAYHVDPKLLPETVDDNLLNFAASQNPFSTGAQSLASTQAKLAEIQLQNQGKVDAAAAKNVGEQQNEFSKKTQDFDAEYLENDLPQTASFGVKISQDASDLYNQLQKHSWTYNIIGGKLGSLIFPSQNEALSKSYDLAIQQLSQGKGASARTKAVLMTILQTKPNVTDPHQAAVDKSLNLWTVGNLAQAQLQFANVMRDHGITSRAAIEEAWDNFLSAKPFQNKDGTYDPTKANIQNALQYFQNNPEDLPQAFHRVVNDAATTGNLQKLPLSQRQTSALSQAFQGQQIPITQQQTNRLRQLMFPSSQTIASNPMQNNGMLPTQTPTDLLMG